MALFGRKEVDVDDTKMNKKLGDKGKPGFSKQNFMESKLFGAKRKKIQIGKKFRQKGKDTGKKSPVKAEQQGNKKGIAPSMEEFDKMMSSVVKKKVSKN